MQTRIRPTGELPVVRSEDHPMLFYAPLLLLVVVVFLISAEFRYAEVGGGEPSFGSLTGSNSIRQVCFLSLGTLGLILLAMPAVQRHKQEYWPLMLPMLGFLVWIFASTLWSDEPSMTFKRAVLMACALSFSIGLAKHWSFDQLAQGIVITASIFLVLGLLHELRCFVFFSSPFEHRYSGLFHPAKQAFSCGLLFLATLMLYLQRGERKFLFLAAVAVAFLLITKARTGVVAAAAGGLVLAWPYLSVRAWVGLSWCTAVIVACALIANANAHESINLSVVTTMGRGREADPRNLTGRLPIWREAIAEFQEQPILGFGYGAFWTDRRLEEFHRNNGWELAHAHSSYIELLVNSGMIGFLIVVLVVVVCLARAAWVSHTIDPSSRLVLALLTMALLGGITETEFVRADGFEFLMVAIGVSLIGFSAVSCKQPGRFVEART